MATKISQHQKTNVVDVAKVTGRDRLGLNLLDVRYGSAKNVML